jgi:dTDP-4-dehydrorhamnose reductase
MLGDAIYKVFSPDYNLKCTDIDINENWLSYLDFRDYKKYLESVISFKPNYLFHIGAHTNLEYCENNQDDAYLTNTTSVENAVYIANHLKIPIIYISTAGIFDGKKDCYDDWDIPNPINCYGRSKYLGELFIQSNSNKYLICRAGWMMGGGPNKDKKFIQKLMLQIKKNEKSLFIVNDKLGTPTYTIDFANNLKLLLENELWGLYNMVCNEITGRIKIASELLNILKLEKKIKITEVSSKHWEKIYFTKRPDSERLINQKLNLRKLNIMRDWRICLKEYINDYYKDYFK